MTFEPNDLLMVVAGTRDQATAWIAENKVDSRRTVIVPINVHNRVTGCSMKTDHVKVGSWTERDDIDELCELLHQRGSFELSHQSARGRFKRW